jgi:acetyl-CoA synthetase
VTRRRPAIKLRLKTAQLGVRNVKRGKTTTKREAQPSREPWLDEAESRAMYRRSIDDPVGFWSKHGLRLDWIKPFTRVKNTSFEPGKFCIKWFEDGTLNVSANCIDRHLATRGDQVAIIWEGDDPKEDEAITYRQLHERVSKLANVLKANGVKKGDRITVYLPMIPEAAYAMLACARTGASHHPHRNIPGSSFMPPTYPT